MLSFQVKTCQSMRNWTTSCCKRSWTKCRLPWLTCLRSCSGWRSSLITPSKRSRRSSITCWIGLFKLVRHQQRWLCSAFLRSLQNRETSMLLRCCSRWLMRCKERKVSNKLLRMLAIYRWSQFRGYGTLTGWIGTIKMCSIGVRSCSNSKLCPYPGGAPVMKMSEKPKKKGSSLITWRSAECLTIWRKRPRRK